MYTLDTNAIIYYIKGDPHVTIALDEIFFGPAPIYISSISEAELFSFKNLTVEEQIRIEYTLRTVVPVPLDSRLARVAAYIRRSYALKLADSIIAATAMTTNSALITRNIRDFKNISGLRLHKI